MPRGSTVTRAIASLLLVACAMGLCAATGASPSVASGAGLGGRGYYPDQAPRWSPDGRRLAFLRGPFEHSSLAFMRRGGAGLRLLPGTFWPLWSPDGGRMALLNGRAVWLGNGDGSHRKRIGEADTAAWSPDGKLLAVSIGGRLWVVNRDGTGLRRLPIDVPTCQNCNSDERSPSWSPDGRTLAFEHGEAEPGSWGVGSVWVSELDGQNLRRLAAPGESPQWSPDGTKIAYLSYPSHYDEVPLIRVVDGNGSRDQSFGRGESPSWAPRGGTLAYLSAGPRRRIYLARPRQAVVYLRAATSPSWSPDGRRLAFERRSSIYVADANGKRQRLVARGIQPSWSPDGRLLAYAGTSCGAQQGIHVIRPNGTRRRRLTNFCFIVRKRRT